MRKIIKILIAFICLLFSIGAISLNNYELKENVYAQDDNDKDSIAVTEEVLDDKLWVSYGVNFSVFSKRPDHIEIFNNLDNYELDELKIILENTIKAIPRETIESSHQKAIESGFVKVIFEHEGGMGTKYRNNTGKKSLTKKNYLYTSKVDGLYKFSNMEGNGGYYDSIYYLKMDNAIYSIRNKDNREEEEPRLSISKFVPLDDNSLDPIKENLNYEITDLFEWGTTISEKEEIQVDTTQKEETFDEKDYTPINYTELMRDRTGKPGYKDTFYAEVMQYEEVSGMAIALLKKSGDIDQLYYAIFNTLPESRLVEDDNVDVYGTLDGLYTYDTVIGGSNTVPRIIVDKIMIEGIDY